ncbi:uncharacterized protein LOC118260228 isoform X2 [Cygnus atratus]|uniref:uncharacterized protein LOC118260228 isoform X2 n=1 Tax=Cygnus atratus TaxID=8868 RepID=UPI0021B78065|nr:uncharacterized protein LOC118260228 isoform X2 [Cygnus atratus]
MRGVQHLTHLVKLNHEDSIFCTRTLAKPVSSRAAQSLRVTSCWSQGRRCLVGSGKGTWLVSVLNVNNHQKQNSEGKDSDFSFDTSFSRHAERNCNPLESHQANARHLQAIDTCPCRGDRRRRRAVEKSVGKQQQPAAWRGEQQLPGQHRRVIHHGVIRHGPIPSPRLGCQGSGQKSGCAHVEPCAARVLR